MANSGFCVGVREKSASSYLSAEELEERLAWLLPLQSYLKPILNYAVTEAEKAQQL